MLDHKKARGSESRYCLAFSNKLPPRLGRHGLESSVIRLLEICDL